MARKQRILAKPTTNTMILYLALMLILLSFFILMNSVAVIDNTKARLAIGSLLGEFGGIAGVRGSKESSFLPTVGENPYIDLEGLQRELDATFRDSGIDAEVKVSLRGKDLALTFPGDLVTSDIPEEVPKQSIDLMNKISELLIKTNRTIRVEGHSAGESAAEEMAFDQQGWRDSVQRALVIANLLREQSIPSDQLVVAGYGAARPLMSNATEQGRLANQRVEIVVEDGATDPALRFRPVRIRVGRWEFDRIDHRGKTEYKRK